MRVEVVNLHKYYGKTRAVNGLNFSFESGSIVGFIGPNGAGKTTTIKIMASLQEPTYGDIYFDGVSITEYPDKIRKVVGYMPDSLPTHRDMIVEEYLDLFARAYGLKGKKRKQVLEEVQEFTNLLGIKDKSLKALSKGMRQRVSLARALVHDPEVLILDEPAAGLDPRARVELRELLTILAEQGKAVIVSSHILTELAEICTDVVIVEKGRLLTAGSIEKISAQRQQQTIVQLRTLHKDRELRRKLLEMPHVLDVRRAASYLEVEVDGGEAECAALLKHLIALDVPLVEYRLQQTKLEDLFMNLTVGEVQ